VPNFTCCASVTLVELAAPHHAHAATAEPFDNAVVAQFKADAQILI
jgi:hypothetical protein